MNVLTQKELPELQILKTVLMHCGIIVTFPIIAFFISRALFFDGLLGLSSVSSNVYSAGVAVLVLHVALGAFIYRAYFSGKEETKTD